MQRRTFLQSLSALAVASNVPVAAWAQASVPKLKITDIKLRKIRLVRELGTTPQRNPLEPAPSRVGGETFIEIMTDQGVSGIGPGVSPMMLARAKHLLVGQDPLLIEQHAYNLFDG